jgi:hypothetical protein
MNTSLYCIAKRSSETDYLFLSISSSRIMALRLMKPLTEISTRNLSVGKGWPARKAHNLAAICKPIV